MLAPVSHTISSVSLILLSCCLHSYYCANMELPEAQQMALEASGELLPPDPLVQRIEKDLKAIRSQFPDVADIVHTPKWQAGKVIVNNAKKESLDKINTSRFGPAEVRAIFQDKIFLVTFQKPYNPEKLGELLQQELGIEGARPDGVIGGSSSITLTTEPSGKNTYVFFKGSGDCFAGCINKSFWKITTGPEDNSVQLVEQGTNNPDGAGGSDQPVGMFGIH